MHCYLIADEPAQIGKFPSWSGTVDAVPAVGEPVHFRDKQYRVSQRDWSVDGRAVE